MRGNKLVNALAPLGVLVLAWSFNLGTVRGCGTGANGTDGTPGFSRSHDTMPITDIIDFELENSSAFTGGNGTDGDSGPTGGNGGTGGDGILLDASGAISDVELENSGTVTGGNGGNGGLGESGNGGDGGDGGAGIALGADDNISDVELENSGSATGGNGGNGGNGSANGGNGGDGGDGIVFGTDGDISDVELKNSGGIAGGNGGNGGDTETGNGGNGGDGGGGIAFGADGNISDINLRNRGTVAGGTGGTGGAGTGSAGNGGAGGDGISLGAGNNISDVGLKNKGTITGGNGGDGGSALGLADGGNGGGGGDGVALHADNDISNVKLKNKGTITGGNGGNGSDGFGFGGDGGTGGSGISLFAGFTGSNISNVKLKNFGTITGGNGGNPGSVVLGGSSVGSVAGEGGDGIIIESLDSDVTGIKLKNSGTITGGNGGSTTDGEDSSEGGNGGNGIVFSAGRDLANIALKNVGTVTGGNGGDNTNAGNDSIAGSGGHGISFTAERDITNVALQNSGTVTGGNGGSITSDDDDPMAGVGGDGIFFSAGSETESEEFIAGTISNVTLINRVGGTITGGNGGEASSEGSTGDNDDPRGGNGGNGVSFSAGVKLTDDDDDLPDGSFNEISHVRLINKGSITGGEGGSASNSFDDTDDSDDPGSVGGNGGHGVSFIAYTGNVTDIFLRNFGSITGGAGGHAEGDTINIGGTGGNGINFHAGLTVSDVDELGFEDNLRRITLINDGTITGGDGGGASHFFEETTAPGNIGGNGGHGVSFTTTTGNITDITIINCGSITGGNGGGAGDAGLGIQGGNGGSGIFFSAADNHDLSNITITNYGSITGGEGADPGGTTLGGPNGDGGFDEPESFGSGGDGIVFSQGNGNNIVVNNFGSITGGDLGDGGFAGVGIRSNADNVTVNNWGNISAGGDAPDTTVGTAIASVPGPKVASTPAPAILITENFNTVNLRGFAVVNGVIKAAGTPNTNELNFQFSGVSRAAAAALQAQFATVPSEVDSTGSITFRGQTYQWEDIIVELETSSYQQQGITKNQKAIGRNLDGFTSTPSDDWRNLLAAVDISGDVPDALNQLSPQRYQLYGDIAVANANYNTFGIDARLNNLRDGSESIDTSCLRLATSKIESRLGFSKDDGGKNVVMARSNDGKTVELPVPEKEKRFGAFISGDIIQGNVDGRNADLEEDANFTTAGLMAGVDARLCKSLVAGLVFSYGHTNSDLDTQGSNVKVETYSGGVYAGFQHGPWYANGLATYSTNDYDSKRVTLPFLDCPPMQDRIAHGNTSGDQFSGNLDGGYDFHVSEALTLAPTAGLQYVRLDVNRFDETQAGAADLAVRDQTMDSLRSRLGGRLTFRKPINSCVAVALEARAAWQHEFLDDSRAITAEFINADLGTFTVHTTDPQRDAALVGTGLNATFYGRFTLFLDYDAQVGQASYLEQGGRGGLRVRF